MLYVLNFKKWVAHMSILFIWFFNAPNTEKKKAYIEFIEKKKAYLPDNLNDPELFEDLPSSF